MCDKAYAQLANLLSHKRTHYRAKFKELLKEKKENEAIPSTLKIVRCSSIVDIIDKQKAQFNSDMTALNYSMSGKVFFSV